MAYLLSVLAGLAGLFVLFLLRRKRVAPLPLPPGPKGLPFIGNTFSLPRTYEWLTYHKWCKELGTDILHLNIFGQSLIILDKAKVANDLLEKRSLIYSARPPFTFLREVVGVTYHFALMNYGDTWRQHRKEAQVYLGSSAHANYRPYAIRSVRRLMGRLVQGPTDINEEFRYTAADVIMSMCYGLDIATDEGSKYLTAVRKGDRAFLEAVVPSKLLVNLLPVLKYLPSWVPGANLQSKAKDWNSAISTMANLPFQAVRRNIDSGTCPPCFCCRKLQGNDSEPKSSEEMQIIRNVAATIYGGGADTIAAVLSSCILGLLSRPQLMRRAREDLDRVVRPGCLPDFSDEPSLPFITAITKEALRWRNVGPLGFPHVTEVEDEYQGYRIPAGSIIITNTWALLNDEEFYDEPLIFKPERFMIGGQYNYAVKDPEYACWGFGRRICVGRYMAFSTLWITIASLIHAFDIEKEVDDRGCTIEPDPVYTTAELAFAPGSFPCRITPRSQELADLIPATSAEGFPI